MCMSHESCHTPYQLHEKANRIPLLIHVGHTCVGPFHVFICYLMLSGEVLVLRLVLAPKTSPIFGLLFLRCGTRDSTYSHVTWVCVTWECVTWECVTWECVTWECVTWLIFNTHVTWPIRTCYTCVYDLCYTCVGHVIYMCVTHIHVCDMSSTYIVMCMWYTCVWHDFYIYSHVYVSSWVCYVLLGGYD